MCRSLERSSATFEPAPAGVEGVGDHNTLHRPSRPKVHWTKVLLIDRLYMFVVFRIVSLNISLKRFY